MIILATIATAFLLYFAFFRTPAGEKSTTEIPGEAPNGLGELPNGEISTPGTNSGSTSDKTADGNGSPISAFKPILRQISTIPTSGGTIFEREGKPTVRYIERAKGNAYETDAKSIKSVRLTNKTIPQIYEAIWNKKGDGVILRFLKDYSVIQTYNAKVSSRGGGEGELVGEFLPGNIKSLAVSPSGNQIFYLSTDSTGGTGIISSFDGKKKVRVFSSPLTEWLVDFPKENTASVISKSAAGSTGLLSFINTSTGASEVVLSNIDGLTALPNRDLSFVIYSQSSEREFTTHVFNNTLKEKVVFPFKTLPEKCVWSQLSKSSIFCAIPETLPVGVYPDIWYMGLVSFRDEIWKIDVKTGAVSFIMNLGDQSRIDFDAVNLSLSEKEDFLLLTNKNDLTLWSIQILP